MLVLLEAPFVRFSVAVLCLFLLVLCLLFLDWGGFILDFLAVDCFVNPRGSIV